jgi:4-cresol dehydrogenase (hydroxylating)
MSHFIDKALEQWALILTPNQIITDKETLKQYETATYKTEQRISAILKPANREQVQEVTRIANQYKTPLYPVSSGKNWGYGSYIPTKDGCVLVDLSLMNRIIKLNKELAYITLEPGVTQEQLYNYLQSEESGLWMDATGASSECSIIGNTLERGFGHTPYGDHFSHVSGLEVVLANGEYFHTGFGRFPNAQASEVYHWGVGAYLDGLFTQSNFGIVTQMTIWLMPAPEYSQAFFCSVDKEVLPMLVDALRPLRLDGTLKSAMHIVNADKAISAFGQYPWSEVNNVTPLPRDWLEKTCKERNIGGWNASGALYGTRAEVAIARKKLKKALRHIPSKKLHFIDDRTLKIANYITRPYKWVTGVDLEKALEIVTPVINLKRGIPSNAFIPSTYWRKKKPAPAADIADPNRDRCGLIWLAPIAPMTGEHASTLEKIIETTLLKFGFEPAISMTLLTERCIDSVIVISYDRDLPEEETRALQCHDVLLTKLIDKGYYPYRLSTHAMGKLPKAEPAYTDVISKFKEAIDPQHIIAPGRYEEHE